MAMPKGSRVQVEGATQVLSGFTLLPATTVRVEPGTCLIVRGANGAGKTTLLRLIAGLSRPSAGSVTIDGLTVDERDPQTRQAVSTLIGPVVSYRDLTLRDHLTLVDATWGGDPDSCLDRVERALAQFTISGLADRFPHELSTGQVQLFHLALVWFRPARLLVLDEPEHGLDVSRRDLLAQHIGARRDEGATVVVASHDDRITETVADDVLDLGGWA